MDRAPLTGSGNPLAVDEGVRPTLPLLLGIFVVHVVIWIGLIALVPGSDRVSFEFLGDESTPFVRQFIIPLIVVLAFQVAVVTRLGWWSSVLRDTSRSRRTWLWAPVGGFIVVAMVGTLASEGWTEAGASYVIGLSITVLLVGVSEELTFRGILLVGGRRLVAREWQAVVFASALFGLFHLPNALLGSALGDEIPHVVQTALIGTLFYAVRRLSGTVVVPMALHGIWDLVVLQTGWDAVVSAAG